MITSSQVNLSQTQLRDIAVKFSDEPVPGMILLDVTFKLGELPTGSARLEKYDASGKTYLRDFNPIARIGVPRGTRFGTKAFIQMCEQYSLRAGDDELLAWMTPLQHTRTLIFEKYRAPSIECTLADWRRYASDYLSRDSN